MQIEGGGGTLTRENPELPTLAGPPVPMPAGPSLGESRQPTADELRAIQQTLGVQETGYGPRTKEAVVNLQMANGIPVNDAVDIGPLTWSLVLQARSGEGKSREKGEDRVKEVVKEFADDVDAKLKIAEKAMKMTVAVQKDKLTNVKRLLEQQSDRGFLKVTKELRGALEETVDETLRGTRYSLKKAPMVGLMEKVAEEGRTVESIGRKVESFGKVAGWIGFGLSVGPNIISHIRKDPTGFYKDPEFRQDVIADTGKWAITWAAAAVGTAIFPGLGTAAGIAVGIGLSLAADTIINHVPWVADAIQAGAKWVDKHLVAPAIDLLSPAAKAIINAAIKPIFNHVIIPASKAVVNIVAPAARFIRDHALDPVIKHVVTPVVTTTIAAAKAVDEHVIKPVVQGIASAGAKAWHFVKSLF